MIKVNHLYKAFENDPILKGIEMNINQGDIYGLIGSNGCGKTTLFKLITGIFKSDQGSVIVNGQIFKKDTHLKMIYYILDDLFFPVAYTLEDLFTEESFYYGHSNLQFFNQLVEFFQMDRKAKLHQLSKGQKKQAAFILAMASQTPIIFLDEIVDGLDAVVRKKFWKILISEMTRRDLTVLISSHALGELDNICDRVGILHEGKIIREETVDSLKSQIKKVQFAIKEAYQEIEHESFEVSQIKQIGKVYYATLKGDLEAFEKYLASEYTLILYEVLDMSLEEIFITELGRVGYGNEIYQAE